MKEGISMDGTNTQTGVAAAGTFAIGGDLPVGRLGYGARDATPATLRRAVDLGVNLIDTADAYRNGRSEATITEALRPYPEGLVVATKGGYWDGRGWHVDGRPEHLRRSLEGSLRRLGLERADLYQLHVVDPGVPIEESVGALAELRSEGKIRHVGVSNVSVEDLERALRVVPVASVQNRYNLADRSSEAVLEACEREGIAFIPYAPLASGSLARPGGELDRIAGRRGVTPSQVALAWLLRRSPVVLPIPGTSSVEHLEENAAAAGLGLSEEEFFALTA